MFDKRGKSLISKVMWNICYICLKGTVKKSWNSQNFDFPNLKKSSPDQFLASSNSGRFYWILKTSSGDLKVRGLVVKAYVVFLLLLQVH